MKTLLFCRIFACGFATWFIALVCLAEPEEQAALSPLAHLLAERVEGDGGLVADNAGATTEEGLELARLEALPAASIPIDGANLGAAVSLVASAAGMSFIAPVEERFPEIVSMSARISPWRLLQLLADRYQFSMRYKEGVWCFDREDPGELFTRIYLLRHTNLDQHKSSQNAYDLVGQSSSGTGGEAQAGASTQSGGLVFASQSQKILEDVRELVGQGGASTAALKSGGHVLYLSDANSLHVTASKSQHTRIEAYLRTVDVPVRQIRIEARFFETTHDPKRVLGIDPAGYQPNIEVTDLSTTLNLARLGATPYPAKTLLSVDKLRFQVQALESDSRNRLVNNPVVVVANNREAYFSVGDEEPFVSSNSYSPGMADGGFGTTQAQVAVRRIGTSVNLVPTYFQGGDGLSARIRLAVRIEVGVLKGFRRLNMVDVPVVSSQKYEYTVYLKPGETLAFGGLSGVAEGESLSKVPLAGDVPVLGGLFRSKSRQASQRNLVAYITASLDEGEAVIPPPEAFARLLR